MPNQLFTYLNQYFLSRAQFIAAAGIDDDALSQLIEAGALPGAIYRTWANGAVWSPIGGQKGVPDEAPSTDWYATAAVWPARSAGLHLNKGATATKVTTDLRQKFLAAFEHTLLMSDGHLFGYSDLFDATALNSDRLTAKATEEWDDWIDGGYAVCLRRWDAFHLLNKNVEIERIRALTQDARRTALDLDEMDELLTALDRLDAVMLPFAPYQRAHGTPGIWVDRLLETYRLGEVPLIFRDKTSDETTADSRLCA